MSCPVIGGTSIHHINLCGTNRVVALSPPKYGTVILKEQEKQIVTILGQQLTEIEKAAEK